MEESWEKWRRMADDTLDDARLLEENGRIRSGVSRYYYAAYQAATAILLYCKLLPPEQREAWSHEATPQMLKDHLVPMTKSQDERRGMAVRLGNLYKLRVVADYVSSKQIESRDLINARKDCSHIVKIIDRVLSER